MSLHVEYCSFTDRKNRVAYIKETFDSFLGDSILDVGCDTASLKNMLPKGVQYTGIDIGGTPDIVINLDEVETLPFDDNSFDTVLCTDVLEHLEHLHRIFDELVRTSKRWLIISLPNCWVNARRPIERGKGSFRFYGLPKEPPEDRHRWFFNMTDVQSFMEWQAQKHALKIVNMHVSEKPRFWLFRLLRRLRYPRQMQYLNRYAHTHWTVFEKL